MVLVQWGDRLEGGDGRKEERRAKGDRWRYNGENWSTVGGWQGRDWVGHGFSKWSEEASARVWVQNRLQGRREQFELLGKSVWAERDGE